MKQYAIFGAGNIGFAVLERLSKDAKVFIFDIKKPDYLTDYIKENNNICFGEVDITNENNLIKVVNEIGCNNIDAAILTVGVTSNKTVFEDYDTFKSIVDINVFGNIIPIRVLVNNHLINNPGKICVLASTSGHFAGLKTNAYASSKWILVNACNSLRSELMEKGISLDIINPRTIKNVRSDKFDTDKGIDVSVVVDTIVKALNTQTSNDYFVPGKYRLFHIIERITPWAFDLTQKVLPHFIRKSKYNKKIDNILITGASSGLGNQLAKLYSSDCKKIYVTARNIDALNELKEELKSKCEIIPIQVDFSEMDAADKTVSNIDDKIDLLINNAGHHVKASILDVDLDVIKKTLQINFYTPIKLITLIPNAHTIVNIASTTAVMGRRNLGVYSSSKAGLWCFTKALRRSKGNEINVIDVVAATFISSLKEKGDNYTNQDEAVNTSKLSSANDGLTSEVVASIVKSGIDKKKDSIYIPKIKTKLYILLEALAPKLFVKIFK